MNDQIKDALELADDTLRLVQKVYGPSRIVEITREKIAAALAQFQALDTGQPQGQSSAPNPSIPDRHITWTL